MDAATWGGLVDVCRSTQTTMMAEGLVSPPTLFPFVGGKLVGHVSLRPVHVGKDAVDGIAEMSTFAAAAGADEVVAVWETGDVAVACDLPLARPEPSLIMMWATSAQKLLYEFPYREQALPGLTEHGLRRVAPRWTEPRQGVVPHTLEAAIEALVEFCFAPLGLDGANPDSAAVYLRSKGYSVRQTV
jgi:hypothetical protein